MSDDRMRPKIMNVKPSGLPKVKYVVEFDSVDEMQREVARDISNRLHDAGHYGDSREIDRFIERGNYLGAYTTALFLVNECGYLKFYLEA